MTLRSRTVGVGQAFLIACGGLSLVLGTLLVLATGRAQAPPPKHVLHAQPPPRIDEEASEKLRAVGYSAWSDRGARLSNTGVTRYDADHSAGGYNLYTDYTDSAYLMDMAGRIVHTWRFGNGESHEFATMLPDGSLLSHGPLLSKQSWDGTEKWRIWPRLGDAFSHDLAVLDDGSMLVLSLKEVDYDGYRVDLEYVEHLSPDLTLHCSWSSLKSLRDLHRFHPPTVFDTPGNNVDGSTDYYHANTLRALPDTPLGRRDARFRKGNWLICLRQVSLVAIIDQDTKKVVWGWGPGVLDHPHSPVMLADGSILLFDNGSLRGYSRLVKVDPVRKHVTWTYEGTPREDFFSAVRGYVQPLPNGNLLVTLSAKGRALEMTADGHVVWDFFHPGLDGDQRRAIYRMIRYPAALVEPLLHGDNPLPGVTPPTSLVARHAHHAIHRG